LQRTSLFFSERRRMQGSDAASWGLRPEPVSELYQSRYNSSSQSSCGWRSEFWPWSLRRLARQLSPRDQSPKSPSSRSGSFDESSGTSKLSLRSAPLRFKVSRILEMQKFEFGMGIFIMCNIFLVIIETDAYASCVPEYLDREEDCPSNPRNRPALFITKYCFVLGYTVEVMIRLWAYRWSFFQNSWNNMDLFVVVTGILGEVFGDFKGLGTLRIFRACRLARLIRLTISFRELYLMVHGMAGAMKAIMCGAIMMFALLTIWSILLVEYVHPQNSSIDYSAVGCERCPRAFNSVMQSNLTLFQQIITGDSWGLISISIIDKSGWYAIPLVLIVITVSLGLTNLILVVIVERAAEAREKDTKSRVQDKERAELKLRKEFVRLCERMDEDNSGDLSMEELNEGWEANETFRNILKSFDIDKSEIESLFGILDEDNSGDVSYKEFSEALGKYRTRDSRMIGQVKASIKHMKGCQDEFVEEFRENLEKQHVLLESISSRLGRGKEPSLPTEARFITASGGDEDPPRRGSHTHGRFHSCLGDVIDVAGVHLADLHADAKVLPCSDGRSQAGSDAGHKQPDACASPDASFPPRSDADASFSPRCAEAMLSELKDQRSMARSKEDTLASLISSNVVIASAGESLLKRAERTLDRFNEQLVTLVNYAESQGTREVAMDSTPDTDLLRAIHALLGRDAGHELLDEASTLDSGICSPLSAISQNSFLEKVQLPNTKVDCGGLVENGDLIHKLDILKSACLEDEEVSFPESFAEAPSRQTTGGACDEHHTPGFVT